MPLEFRPIPLSGRGRFTGLGPAKILTAKFSKKKFLSLSSSGPDGSSPHLALRSRGSDAKLARIAVLASISSVWFAIACLPRAGGPRWGGRDGASKPIGSLAIGSSPWAA
jgi:hypothetical protein